MPRTKAPGSLALRRAIDAAIGELLFHREHLDGLCAVLLAQRPPQEGQGHGGEEEGGGGGEAGGGRSRKRQRKGKEGEAARGQPPPPQEGGVNKWAAYQGQLLQAMEGWVNGAGAGGDGAGAGAGTAAAGGGGWAPETRALVLSLPHLYRSFVRRLGAAAAVQQQGKAAAGAGAGRAQAGREAASSSSGAAAGGDAAATAAAVGQKRRELEAAAAAASASAHARPSFAMALRLWALLWRPGGQQQDLEQEDEEARVARLVAARGVLEAVLSLGVYHYDSDQRCASDRQRGFWDMMTRPVSQTHHDHTPTPTIPPNSAGGQFRSVERVFLQLLDAAATAAAPTTLTTSSPRVMEGEVLCLAALLRLDHRVAGRGQSLPRLLGLLAARYDASEGEQEQGQGQEQQQRPPSPLRRACVATVGEAADTYGRLRQVGALLRALLALEAGPEGAASAAAARALVMDAEVGAALGRAIRDCPPPQFVPLWDALAGGGGRGGDEEEEKEEVDEAVVMRQIGAGGVRYCLLSLLLANVRVSALNAGALGARAAAVMERVRGKIYGGLFCFCVDLT